MIRQAVYKTIMAIGRFAYAHTLSEARAGVIQIQEETIASLQGAIDSRERASESAKRARENMEQLLTLRDEPIASLRDDLSLLKRKVAELEGLKREEAA